MDKVKIHLENCYGIKKLKHEFDFTKSKAQLIYAPNGVMKSSFAKTLEDIATGVISKDRIFVDRVTHRDIKVDGGDIKPEEIFVIQRMNDVDFKEASTILANESLKKKYDLINIKLNESKKDFLKLIQPYFGLKENLIELEITKVFIDNFYSILENIEEQVNEIKEPLYADIKYNEIFNEKAKKFLGDKDFKIKIKDYINTYDQLVNENTTLFMKGTFNHYNADTITKSLKENNFFKANHKVKINNEEIEDIDKLEELIESERAKVLNNPELTTKFNEIDKLLNSNVELRKFRNYIEENQEVIKEFIDLKNFSKKLLLNYFACNKDEFNVLLKLYRDTNIERNHIIDEAKNEQDDWKNVLEIFKRRFTIPFKVKIKNQEDVILKNDPASLIFEYTDGASVKELGGAELQESLSTGEQRVFYLLNIIFQIESKKNLDHDKLMIIDDIADSFDYKNKYAIIEYLKDVLEDPKFNMVILTHNFDFYKTIKSRLGSKINYEGNWRTIKKSDEIILVIGEKNDVFPTLRKNYHLCDFTLIACIPFVRNLIDFTVGSNVDDYLTLTSLLHLKPKNEDANIKETKEILKSEIFTIFNKVFNLDLITENPDEKIYDLILSKALDIYDNPNDDSIDIKDKICLSLAIRLVAEEFILKKITDVNFISNILKKQTGQIVGQYKKEFPLELRNIDVLDRVNLMTPENIHVNSFMYEPLMDLSNDHLKILYFDVNNLN